MAVKVLNELNLYFHFLPMSSALQKSQISSTLGICLPNLLAKSALNILMLLQKLKFERLKIYLIIVKGERLLVSIK